jgi:hypothetical protein
MTRTLATTTLVLALALAACKTQPPGPPAEPATGETSGAAVEQIVFIDMKEACDCTMKRTEGSWGALEKATEGLDIPVTRIHMDEDDAAAAKYKKMKPYMAIPAVYFLDPEGNLAGMLQGEITQGQFEAVISGQSG